MVKSWDFLDLRRGRLVLAFVSVVLLIVSVTVWGVWTRGGKMQLRGERVAFVDSMNDEAANWLFVNPDSAEAYACRAERAASGYSGGLCEAWNHQMYVCVLKMDFDKCENLYDCIVANTHNEIELFAAEVGMMWICQRGSQNKAFFDHSDRAMRHLKRITDEGTDGEGRGKARTERATTLFYLAQAAYHTQLLQEKSAQDALAAVDTEGYIRRDKALLSLYWYLNGAMAGQGRMWKDVEQTLAAFDSYLTVYSLAAHYGYPYFVVKSELSLAGLLANAWNCKVVEENRAAELDYLYHLFSVEDTEAGERCDLRLPMEMASTGLEQALGIGSLWLEAEARLVLGEVEFAAGNYLFALEEYGQVISLLNAHHRKYYPKDKVLLEMYDASDGNPVGIVWAKAADTQTVPGLLMAVREQLSLTYSALDDKPASDYNRNAYLDLLDFTRQDRSLESRVHAAARDNRALEAALRAVVVLSLLFSVSLILYARKWRKRDMRQHQLLDDMSRWFMDVASGMPGHDAAMTVEAYPWMKKEKRILEEVLRPYVAWAKKNRTISGETGEECERIHDEIVRINLRTERHKRENIRKRAKVSLVHDVLPLIGRILHAVDSMKAHGTGAGTLDYVEELADEINRHNEVLTEWIRLNQGELALAVESFSVQPLFELLSRGELLFRKKGVALRVVPTELWVKADKALTFFMLHTLADNARKFTPTGGTVEVRAEELADAVEISVADTGCGLSEEDMAVIRSSKVYDASKIGRRGDGQGQKGHGFGLLNCKGIIEKYRKAGGPFGVCRFQVESRLGEGCRFSFRLPKGIMRTWMVWAVLSWGVCEVSRADGLRLAASYADSVYFANINGDYARGIQMADTAFRIINAYYAASLPVSCREEMLTTGGGGEEELSWRAAGVKADYHLIMGLRNEVAIAALALRRWDVYGFNSFQFSHLYKLLTKDSSLDSFYLQQRQARSALNMGIVLLVLLVSLFGLSAYVVYFRRRILFRFNAMQVLEVNRSLLSAAGCCALSENDGGRAMHRMLSVALSGLGELHGIRGLRLLLRPEQEKGRYASAGMGIPEMNGVLKQAYESGADVADPVANIHAYPLLLRKGKEGDTFCFGAVAMDYGDYRMRKEDFVFERYVVNYLSIMLYETIVLRGLEQTDVETAQEERRRALFEENRLRVQNQILDNCLSSIKHESMYYPSRIKQIVHGMRECRTADAVTERIGDLREVVTYYEEVYTLLCAQADRQVETSYFKCLSLTPGGIVEEWLRLASRMAAHGTCAIDVRGENLCADDVRISADNVLTAHLLETLTKEWVSRCGEAAGGWLKLGAEADGRFVRFSLSASWDAFPPGSTDGLFYSGKAHYPYLLCKEAMREQDRLNNFCGCRIETQNVPGGGSLVWFTLPRNEGGKQI